MWLSVVIKPKGLLGSECVSVFVCLCLFDIVVFHLRWHNSVGMSVEDEYEPAPTFNTDLHFPSLSLSFQFCFSFIFLLMFFFLFTTHVLLRCLPLFLRLSPPLFSFLSCLCHVYCLHGVFARSKEDKWMLSSMVIISDLAGRWQEKMIWGQSQRCASLTSVFSLVIA